MIKNETVKLSPSGCVICPKCGGETNRHAEKVDYSAPPADPADTVFGGVLAEFHTCPGCKNVIERPCRS